MNLKKAFRLLVLEIGNKLDKEDIDDVKFYINNEEDNVIDDEELQSIDTGKAMLKVLSRKNILHEENLDWLKSILENNGKKDLAQKCEDFISANFSKNEKKSNYDISKTSPKEKNSECTTKYPSLQKPPVATVYPQKPTPNSLLTVSALSSASSNSRSTLDKSVSSTCITSKSTPFLQKDTIPDCSFEPDSFHTLKGPNTMKQYLANKKDLGPVLETAEKAKQCINDEVGVSSVCRNNDIEVLPNLSTFSSGKSNESNNITADLCRELQALLEDDTQVLDVKQLNTQQSKESAQRYDFTMKSRGQASKQQLPQSHLPIYDIPMTVQSAKISSEYNLYATNQSMTPQNRNFPPPLVAESAAMHPCSNVNPYPDFSLFGNSQHPSLLEDWKKSENQQQPDSIVRGIQSILDRKKQKTSKVQSGSNPC